MSISPVSPVTAIQPYKFNGGECKNNENSHKKEDKKPQEQKS